MRQKMAVFVALTCGWALACATDRSDHPYQGGSPTSGSKRQVNVEVSADFRVSPDPVRLSKAGNHEAYWILKEGSGPLRIEPKESEEEWPLMVSCETATQCVGRIKANGKEGSHSYRVVIGDKAGPDPVIIIEP